MIQIRKIVVPTDFSENARRAYHAAGELASLFSAQVDLIHVIPNAKFLQENLMAIDVPLDLEEDLYPGLIDQAAERLEQDMKEYIDEEFRGYSYVKLDRKPSATITGHARENGYDMIVMGARGKHESGFFRGSTTSNVVRDSDVPVLSVEDSMDRNRIFNILLPTDRSPLSLSALPFAAAFALHLHAEITLLHVTGMYSNLSEKAVDIEKEREGIYEDLLQRLQDFISDTNMKDVHLQRGSEKFADRIVIGSGGNTRSVPLNTVISSGNSAHHEIISFADEDADLIVLTTHGYSARSMLHLGSVAEKVTQQVRKPVLTVRPSKNLFRRPDGSGQAAAIR